MKNIIIEGLTGAGKSTLISYLVKALEEKNIDYEVVYETETYGELLDEIGDESLTDYQKCFRLRDILSKVKNDKAKLFILERFHLSYYAVIPDWDLYSEIDKTLSENNFLMILLHYDEKLFNKRALQHNDLNDTGWQDVINYFGSEEKALESYKNSQDRRKEALQKTKIPHIQIDTSEMNWQIYAENIVNQIL